MDCLTATRDNVRSISRTFKAEASAVSELVNELEELHTAYAAKREKPKLTREFKAVRTSINKLLCGLRKGGF